ncbi:MAG: PHP domain-containing protein [Clostridiales bacterium]|nr:PHP domain-containing protein [Clostridiales bacterium]
MSVFLLETHAHTAEVSSCGNLYSNQVIDSYIDEGYDAIVITDHFHLHFFKRNSHLNYKEQVDKYLSGYRAAKAYAGNKMKVFLGLEISLDGDPNDYLIFGVEEEFLHKNKNLCSLDIKHLSDLVRENNYLLVQAHPFRKNMRIVNPSLLDGIEVYNGNSGHNSSNNIAKAWAQEYNLIETSGTDFHYYFRMKPGGILFKNPINTNAELVKALRSREYSLRL